MTDLARSSGFGICMLLFVHVLVVFLGQLAWVDNGGSRGVFDTLSFKKQVNYQ